MARWSEEQYRDFLRRSAQLNSLAPDRPVAKRRRAPAVARMSDTLFDEILAEDGRQGRSIRFELPLPPLPKRSARVAHIREGKPISYIPKPTRKYMDNCKLLADLAMRSVGQPVYRLSVRMDVIFCFLGEESELPTHPSDGDLDNLEKALYDGLSKVVCQDDRLVSAHENHKVCVGRTAGIIVVVTPLRPSNVPKIENWTGQVSVKQVECPKLQIPKAA